MSFEMIYGILFTFLVIAVILWFLGETRPIQVIVIQERPVTTLSNNAFRYGKPTYSRVMFNGVSVIEANADRQLLTE